MNKSIKKLNYKDNGKDVYIWTEAIKFRIKSLYKKVNEIIEKLQNNNEWER